MDEFNKFSPQPFRGMGGIRQQQRPEASGRPRTQLEEAHMPMGSYANRQDPFDAHRNSYQRPRPPRMDIPGSMRSKEAQLRHCSQSAYGSQQSVEDSGYGKKNPFGKRFYDRKMTDKKRGKVPFSVLSYLAVLNAGKALPVSRIYDFVREHFPGCITPGSDSWQKSIRENVAKYTKLFEKKSIDEVDNPDKGRKNASHWAIRKRPETTIFFAELLRKFLNRRLCEEDMGMANPDDWESILNGTMGFPPVLVKEVEEKHCDRPEDDWEPSTKRFSRDEEAERAANALERGQKRYEQNGYDNQGYPYDRAQMIVSDVNQRLQYASQPYNRMGTGVQNYPYDDVVNFYRTVYDQQMLVSNAHITANVNHNLRQQQGSPSSSESGSSHRQKEENAQQDLHSNFKPLGSVVPMAIEQYLNFGVTDG